MPPRMLFGKRRNEIKQPAYDALGDLTNQSIRHSGNFRIEVGD
jgi:hypothetical protein